MSEASAAAERHPPGPLRMLRARVGAMRTMSRRLRLVTGVAIAQLFAAAALLAVHDLKMSSTPVAAAARLSSIANPIFIVCIFFLAFAWSYLLVGALHSHWLVRIAALLFFTYVAARSADGVYLRGFYQWPWVATVGALWLFAAGTWIVDLRRESRGDHGSPSVVRLSIVFILMLALYASFRWGGNSFYRAQNSRGFTNLISTQLNDLAIYLVPVLLLAGAEFADWGEIVGERVSVAVEHSRVPLGLAGITLIGAGASAVYLLATAAGGVVVRVVVFVVGGLALAGLMRTSRRGQPWPGAVPYAAVLVAAGIFFVGLRAESAATSTETPKSVADVGGRLIEYDHKGKPPFAIRYPAGWEVAAARDSSQLTLTTFDGILEGYGVALFDVVGEQLPPGKVDPRDVNAAVTDFLTAAGTKQRVRVGPVRPEGGWRRRDFSLVEGGHVALSGLSWARADGHTLWLLYGLTAPAQSRRWEPLLGEMFKSWRPGVAHREAAAEDRGTTHSFWVAGTWLVVALGLALAVLMFGRRSRTGQLLGAAIFLIAVGVLFGVNDVQSGLGGERSFRVAVTTVQLVVALVSVATVVRLLLTGSAAASKHTLIVLFTLNVGMWVLAGMATVYGKASQASGQFSISQGLIIFLALIWELTVSGSTVTTGDGPRFPRHARVLLFSGYVMLLATTVLFFSSLKVQATGARVAPLFESESFVQAGILWLGIPLLVCGSLFRLRRGRDSEAEADA